MYKIFKGIIGLVWLLDICNINVSGISWLAWLQPLITDSNNMLNFFGWLCVWAILPSTNLHVKLNKEDK